MFLKCKPAKQLNSEFFVLLSFTFREFIIIRRGVQTAGVTSKTFTRLDSYNSLFKSGCVFVLERNGPHSLDSRIPSSYQFIHMFLLEQRFFLSIYRYRSSSASSSREYVRFLCFILILCLHSCLSVAILAGVL